MKLFMYHPTTLLANLRLGLLSGVFPLWFT